MKTRIGAVTAMTDATWFRYGFRFLFWIALACSPVGCRGGRTDVPPEIRGVWRTDRPEYEGRYFELREKTLVVATGLEPPESFAIDFVEEVGDDERVTHRIHYVNLAGQDYLLSIIYDADRDRIVYSNQPNLVWHRE